MSKNILWQNLSAKEINKMIREWPVQGEATQPKAKTKPAAKPARAVGPVKTAVAGNRQRHFGADGEIKFVEHRNLFVGFFGGRVVVTKRTREACQEALKVKFGVKLQGE